MTLTTPPQFRYITTQLVGSGSKAALAELPLTNVRFSSTLNGIGSLSADLQLSGIDPILFNVAAGTTPAKTAIFVDYNGVLVWGGVIWSREYDSQSQTYSIQAEEFGSYFDKRRIVSDITKKNTAPGTIAQNLITYAQSIANGNIGVVNAPVSSGGNIDQWYYAYELKSVYQAIVDLSKSSASFDFMFSPYYDGGGLIAVEFITAYQMGTKYDMTVQNGNTLEFPGNILRYRFPEDGKSVANSVFTIGAGASNAKLFGNAVDTNRFTVFPDVPISNITFSGSTMKVWCSHNFNVGMKVTVAFADHQSLNGTFTVLAVDPSWFTVTNNTTDTTYVTGGRAYASGDYGNWPLLEDVYNYTSVNNKRLLDTLALGIVAATSYPPVAMEVVLRPEVDPVLTAYNIGDEVRLIIKDDKFPFLYGDTSEIGGLDLIYRITAISVSVGDGQADEVTLTLQLPYATAVLQ